MDSNALSMTSEFGIMNVNDKELVPNQSMQNPLWVVAFVICLSEKVEQLEGDHAWNRYPNLQKRRGVYSFDLKVQGSLCEIGKVSDFEIYDIACGNESFYRAEFCKNKKYYMHVFDTENPTPAEYKKTYYKLNHGIATAEEAHYLYLSFRYDKETKSVRKVLLNVPNENGKILERFEVNIETVRNFVRALKVKHEAQVDQIIERIKEENRNANLLNDSNQ